MLVSSYPVVAGLSDIPSLSHDDVVCSGGDSWTAPEASSPPGPHADSASAQPPASRAVIGITDLQRILAGITPEGELSGEEDFYSRMKNGKSMREDRLSDGVVWLDVQVQVSCRFCNFESILGSSPAAAADSLR